MKKYKFNINGNNYAVDIKEVEDQTMIIEVNGTSYEVQLEKALAKAPSKTPVIRPSVRTSQTAAPIQASGKLNKVHSPLPGVILHIKVSAGDIVKKGQVLMIMEAMKMENNILADRDGTLKSINVKEGQSVLQGDVLAEIE